VFKGLKKK